MSIEDVTKAKSDLLAAGQNLDGKCGAHKIAAQTAWNMRGNGEGWGLVHSTGSGCTMHAGTPTEDIYRADSLMQRDGTTKDILQYAESRDGLVYPEVDHSEYNIPTWSETGPQDPANWRDPYDPHLVDDIIDNGGETDGDTSADTDEILDAIAAVETSINAHTTSEADRVIQAVLDDIKRIEEEVERFAAQVGKALLILAVKRRDDDSDSEQP